jgi:hypothetical protein
MRTDAQTLTSNKAADPFSTQPDGAAADWPFFCVARSTVMIQIAALRCALKNSQLTCGETQGI